MLAPARPSIAAPRRSALRDYQVRAFFGLVRAIARYPGATLTVMFPRQAGKNEVAASLVACLLHANAARGGTVIVCAPTYDPQARISLDRVQRMMAAVERLLPQGIRTVAGGNEIRLGRARAIFLSASPEANVAGHTASLALIADEAQDIDRDWFHRQFRPMAASTGAPAILFGTAWDGRSLLERAAAGNRNRDGERPLPPGWLPWHYQVTWEEVAASRPAYGDYVRHERESLGHDHPLFLSQYELVGSQAAGRLLSPGQIARLRGGHPRLPAPVPGERYAAGLDFGGHGRQADATVLTIARVDEGRSEVVQHIAWYSQPFERVEAELSALVAEWRLERVCADATGLGQSLVARLQARHGPRIEPVAFTSGSKSALGFGLLAAVESGRLSLYMDDGSSDAARCWQELRECGAELHPGRRMTWGNPSGHDDYAVSLALCARAADTLGPPRVAVGRGRG